MDDRKKQIEEMAREMCHLSAECKTCQICNERYHGDDDDLCYFKCVAKEIINHGYRKQSVGEWKTNIPATIRVFETNSVTCSLCGHGGGGSIDKPYPNFCPNCGARMKGGEG